MSYKSKLHPKIFKDQTTYKQMTEFTLEGRLPSTVSFIEDLDTEYSLNSLGYRSAEFIEGLDILAIGCSQTVGLGVDQDKIWPEVLARITGATCVNLGVVGASVGGMVELAMAYIRDYGPPKTICAVLPGLYRMILPINKDVNVYVYNRSDEQFEIKNVNLAFASEGVLTDKSFPTLSKRPHSLNDVIPNEVALHQSMMSLNHLIHFCSATGIELHMTSWEVDATSFLLEMSLDTKLDLSGFYKLDLVEDFFYDPESVRCHPEIADETRLKGRDTSGHMGSHQHRHIAELFASEIKKL